MKIVKQGEIPEPEKAWWETEWECGYCHTIFIPGMRDGVTQERYFSMLPEKRLVAIARSATVWSSCTIRKARGSDDARGRAGPVAACPLPWIPDDVATIQGLEGEAMRMDISRLMELTAKHIYLVQENDALSEHYVITDDPTDTRLEVAISDELESGRLLAAECAHLIAMIVAES